MYGAKINGGGEGGVGRGRGVGREKKVRKGMKDSGGRWERDVRRGRAVGWGCRTGKGGGGVVGRKRDVGKGCRTGKGGVTGVIRGREREGGVRR